MWITSSSGVLIFHTLSCILACYRAKSPGMVQCVNTIRRILEQLCENGQWRYFGHVELPDGFAFVIAEKGESCIQTGAEGGTDLWCVGTDDGEFAVADSQVVL